ncbi:MAG: adaptor protein MecA [Lachnospiraceae bacterium]|nr:adaptor protein MecA [Lachnospiraceae bacterium]
MHIIEMDLYKVSCTVDRTDLRQHGVTLDDLVNRTPLGRMFIKKASEISKESTDYEWPGCAYSMQMDIYNNNVVLVFSERIDDYLYNLRSSSSALPKEQAALMDKMIAFISMAEEDEAREMIKRFEENVKEVGE